MLISVFVLVLAILFKQKQILEIYSSDELFNQIRMVLVIPVIVLWVNNLMVWSKKDKHVGRFFLLFFLNGLYSPFYFRKILKHKWQ
jgi:hypothetical protein